MTDNVWPSPPGIVDLHRTLTEAGLNDVSWDTRLGSSAIHVHANAWAHRDHEEQGASAARRGLLELAEQAITLTEQAGFEHAGQPEIGIAYVTKLDRSEFQHRSGYELTLTLALRRAGDAIPTPAGPIHIVQSEGVPEGAALLVAFGGVRPRNQVPAEVPVVELGDGMVWDTRYSGRLQRRDQPWSTELHQDGKQIAASTGVEVSDALGAARTSVLMADSNLRNHNKPWSLHVYGPHGAQATFRTLEGYEAAAAATTWHQVRDAMRAEWEAGRP